MADKDSPKFEATINGKRYSLAMADVTGREAREFRRAVGVALPQAAVLLETGEIDLLELMAGIKWLVDRRHKEDLSYEDVLDGLTYESLSMEVTEEEPPPDPLTRGGSSEPSYPPSLTSTALNPGS